MDGFVEKELATGVTFYERVGPSEARESSETKAPSMEEQMLEVDARLNSIEHLVRSNEELRVAVEEAFDQDFKDAIEENIIVIAKLKAELLSARQAIFEQYGVTIPLPERVFECPGLRPWKTLRRTSCLSAQNQAPILRGLKIGRASCRERV